MPAPQAVRQDVRGDPGQLLAEFAEATTAVEQGLDDEQAPAVADPVEGALKGRWRSDGPLRAIGGHGDLGW